MRLDELIAELRESTEPGTKVVIEFYKGTQQEDQEGTYYDDDDWSIYTIKGNASEKRQVFISVGGYLEQAIENALKKMKEKEEVFL